MHPQKTTCQLDYSFIYIATLLFLLMPYFLTAQAEKQQFEMKDTAQAIQLLETAKELKGEKDYLAANEKIEEAKEIYTQVFGPESIEVANCWYQIGNNYYLKRDLDEAIDILKKALDIQIKVLGEHHETVAQTCNKMGVSYRRKGDADNAFHYYKQAKDVWAAIEGTEIHEEVAKSYDRFGLVFMGKDDYDLALQYINKSLEIRWKMYGKTIGNMAANTFYDLGRCHYFLKDYDQAIEWQQKALDHWKIRSEEQEIDAGYNHFEIAKSYREKGEYELARVHYDQALVISSAYPGYKLNFEISIYASLGSILLNEGDYEKAIVYQDSSLNILLGNYGKSMHSRVAYSLHQKGLSYLHLGNYEEAIRQLNQSLEYVYFKDVDSLETVNSFPFLINSLIGKGEVYRKWYLQTGDDQHLLESKAAFDLFDKIVDYQRNNLSGSSKIVLSDDVRSGYEGAISTARLLAERKQASHYLTEAFGVTEKSHSLALFESMRQTEALRHSGIPDSLLAKEHHLQIDIAHYEKQRQSALSQGAEETDAKVLAHSGKLFKLKRAYENLKKLFEEKYPNYYQLKYDMNTVNLKEIQKSLINSRQALVEYFVGDSSIFTFTILKDTFYVNEIKKDFPLEEWVGEMLHGIYDPFTVGGDDLKCAGKYTKAAHQLYTKIFAEVNQHLPENTEIIIVPDGVLGYIPFDALLVEAPENPQSFHSHHYLLHDHQFSYAYSATLLREMSFRKHGKEPAKNILAFAPSFNETDQDSSSGLYVDAASNRNWLGPLQYNDDEVRTIDSLLGADVYLDDMATEDRFMALAEDYRILHLSTHGMVNDKVGDYSFLAFYELDDSLENERLYNRELYNLRLNADMVVLSACETGIGELQRGEGIISLARGFSYAGAKSIITTLWSVNDLSMKNLMGSFYSHLRSGQSKDAALRHAKLDFLLDPQNQDKEPFFWAGIIPVGDMSPVDLGSGWRNWWIYGLIGFGVLGFLFYFFRKK